MSELFYPNKTSTAYIMTEIAKHLSLRQSVKVICADMQYDDNFDRNASDDELKNIKVIRTTKPKGSKDRIIGKILNAVQTSFSFGWSITKTVRKDDTVFAVTNPFLLVLILGIIRVFKTFNYVLLVHDVFPENAVPAGLVKVNGFSYRMSKKIYDWAYNKADQLLVLGRDMAALVEEKTGSPHKIQIVENWFDNDLHVNDFLDRNKYVGKDLSGKIVIGFAGNMGRVQNLPEFLALFNEVQNSLLHFLIIGDGAARKQVEDIINTNELKNVSYIGSRPRAEQSDFLNCCDIGLVTLAEGMRGLGVPSKSYNLLALGKPILFIGDRGSEIDLLIKESNIGWSFDWERRDEIINFLENLTEVQPALRDQAVKLANERFSENIVLSKLEEVLV